MSWLADYVLGSGLIQGLVTLALVGVLVFCAVTARPIPPELKDALYLVLGFWFGARSALEAQRLSAKIKAQKGKEG